MSGFEVGNVYSRKIREKKTYYMAINKETLITYMGGRFGKFTTKKKGHVSENGLSVSELCDHWSIRLSELDKHMLDFFHPDEDAKMRARKEKYEEL